MEEEEEEEDKDDFENKIKEIPAREKTEFDLILEEM